MITLREREREKETLYNRLTISYKNSLANKVVFMKLHCNECNDMIGRTPFFKLDDPFKTFRSFCKECSDAVFGNVLETLGVPKTIETGDTSSLKKISHSEDILKI